MTIEAFYDFYVGGVKNAKNSFEAIEAFLGP
jgi:hypothetical protein